MRRETTSLEKSLQNLLLKLFMQLQNTFFIYSPRRVSTSKQKASILVEPYPKICWCKMLLSFSSSLYLSRPHSWVRTRFIPLCFFSSTFSPFFLTGPEKKGLLHRQIAKKRQNQIGNASLGQSYRIVYYIDTCSLLTSRDYAYIWWALRPHAGCPIKLMDGHWPSSDTLGR